MKIVTLMENTACDETLAAEHGLSLYIETGAHTILFDAGASGAFVDNAEKLGVDLTQVEFAVLSHGHYDHGGGLTRFLEINDTAPVYLNPHAFEPHYNASGKYIGLASALAESGRLRFAEDGQKLAQGITLYSRINCPFGIRTENLTVMEDGQLRPEDFRHEQYLLVEEGGKRVLFSGCSHRGILNIVDWFRPDVLIGGFHFMNLDPGGEILARAAEQLMKYPTVYYTGHCTGGAQFAFLKGRMGARLREIHAGTVFEL